MRPRSRTRPPGTGDRASYGYTWVQDGADDARRYVESALAHRDSGRPVPFGGRHLASGDVVGSSRFLDLDVFAWPPPWPSDENPPTVAEIGSTWYSAGAQRTGVNTAGSARAGRRLPR